MFVDGKKSKINSPFLFCIWTGCLSLSWIIPNHNYPWASFHMDAWISLVYAVLLVAILGFSRESRIKLGGLPLVIAGILVWVTAQYFLGKIFQVGNYVVSSMYLFGFLLMWLVGAYLADRQQYEMLDATALAISIASIISVALQLNQWLQIYDLNIWSMGGGESRPYANLGQPNQLGTILLWGGIIGIVVEE